MASDKKAPGPAVNAAVPKKVAPATGANAVQASTDVVKCKPEPQPGSFGFRPDHLLLWVFFALALVSRWFRISVPGQVVFDETHFGKFMNHYCCDGLRFFDIHPPFGKLMLAAFAKIIGYTGQDLFDNIMTPYLDGKYILLRSFCALIGSLMVPIMFLTVRAMKGSVKAACLATTMVLLETATIVEQRLILTDAFLMTFCQWAFYCFIRVQHEKELSDNWKKWVVITGFAFSFALSVKWVAALATYGMCGVVTAWGILRSMLARNKSRPHMLNLITATLWKVANWIVVPVVFYAACFAIHWSLLSGHLHDGEDDFMLLDNKDFYEFGFLRKLTLLNQKMYTASATLEATHHWASSFWTWPVMLRGVNYWTQDHLNGTSSKVYLIGNPGVWYLCLFAVVVFFAYVLCYASQLLETSWTEEEKFFVPAFYAFAGWALNYWPFVTVSRHAFLYHYIPALLYSMILVAFIFDRMQYSANVKNHIFWLLIIVFFAGFVFFAPYVYSVPLTTAETLRRTWLKGWD